LIAPTHEALAPLATAVQIFVRDQLLDHQPRDRTLLHEAVGSFLSCSAADILISSHCPQCGSRDHGVPVATFREASRRKAQEELAPFPTISLSRCEGLVAVALTAVGILGIDVESVSRISRASIDDVAFHTEEISQLERLTPVDAALHRTILWAAKEAILKAAGTGLTVAPDLLWCEISANTVTLREWPDVLRFSLAPHLTIIDLGEHRVCAVAHSPDTNVIFSWWPFGAKSPS